MTPKTHLKLAAVPLFALIPLFGCESGGGEEEVTAEEQQALDIAEFEELTEELERNRTEFAGTGPSQLYAYNDKLFWLDYNNQWNPSVYALIDGDENKIVEISGDYPNYRVSDDMLVTAVPDGQEVHYESYDFTGKAGGVTTTEAPKSEARWFAYAVDGEEVFLVKDDETEEVVSFDAGASPSQVATFAEMGVDLQIFWDFDVVGDEMIFIESGRIWVADLKKKTATWLENEQEAYGAASTDDHIIYSAADGIHIYDRSSGTSQSLDDLLEANSYAMNETFASAHLRSEGDFGLANGKITYVGNHGIFAYDYVNDEVQPILLDPRDEEVRIEYRNPAVVTDGVLYTVGLESTSGSVGADGPVWRVDHPFLK